MYIWLYRGRVETLGSRIISIIGLAYLSDIHTGSRRLSDSLVELKENAVSRLSRSGEKG